MVCRSAAKDMWYFALFLGPPGSDHNLCEMNPTKAVIPRSKKGGLTPLPKWVTSAGPKCKKKLRVSLSHKLKKFMIIKQTFWI